MSGAAIIPSLIPFVVVIAMRRAEKSIHRQLSAAGAFNAESATRLTLNRSFEKRRLAGLVQGGAIHATADNRHFLDAEGWENYRESRRKRVLLALTFIIALLGIGFAVFDVLR